MPRRSSTASKNPWAMRLLHLDPFSGIAGNMFVAALLDAGLKKKDLESELQGLRADHRLKLTKVKRGALSARYLEVVVKAKAKKSGAKGKGQHAQGGGGKGKSLRAIGDHLQKAELRDSVRERALAIFENLGKAEARVHGVSLDKVHFHEVGAVDALVDVTAAAIGVDQLDIGRVTSAPVALGQGSVETAHGNLPLPAPATLELLKGVPTRPAYVNWETVTPTGAAILRTLVNEFGPMPAMTIDSIGLGAGDDREGPMPNLLRVILGRSEKRLGRDCVTVLETNLDDLVPEHFDFVMERLFEAGALDVSLQHIQMKKNRPGFLLRVISRQEDRDHLSRVLLAESGSIGVRAQEWDRLMLERETGRVETPFGRIRVKWVSTLDGGLDVSAEYDDCSRAAARARVPLREVVRVAEQIARSERT